MQRLTQCLMFGGAMPGIMPQPMLLFARVGSRDRLFKLRASAKKGSGVEENCLLRLFAKEPSTNWSGVFRPL